MVAQAFSGCGLGLLTAVASLVLGLPRWYSGRESGCQYRTHRRPWFESWVRKIPWRRTWQPTPVFLPGKFHGQRSLAGYSSQGHRVRHDSARTQALIVECRLKALGLQELWRTGLFAPRHVEFPGPGIEPVSPALTGGFLSTVTPGKFPRLFLILYMCYILCNLFYRMYFKKHIWMLNIFSCL